MAFDGSLVFDTEIDKSGFNRDAKTLKNSGNELIKSLGLALSAGAVAKGLVSLGTKAVNLTSDLQEVQNVVDVTFGDNAEQINTWAKTSASSFGLSELAAKQYAGTIGAMMKSSGVAIESITEMSTAITGLAGDFASFYNITSEEAFEKIRSGISGETEPLKQLGINMSVANLEAFALAQGIEKTYDSMTQAEQVMLRYNYLMSVSADAQGDFARTSDSFANSVRIVEMNLDRAGTTIGDQLLPTVTSAVSSLADMSGELADAMDTGGIEAGISYLTTELPLATAAVTGLVAAYSSMAVIKAITGYTKSYAAVRASLTVLEQAGTVAEWAEIGALTSKQIIVAALTGKLKLLSAAQALYNKVLLANPAVAAATAIGALVGSLVLLDRALVKSNPEMYEAEQRAIALKNAVKDAATAAEASAESYQENIDGIEKNALAADKLIDKLSEMSNAYTGSTVEQKLMQSLVDELNSSVSGLNMSFDAQTGKLNMTADAMKKYAQQAMDTAKQEAALERYVELVKEQADAEYNLYAAQKEKDEFLKSSGVVALTTQYNIMKAYSDAQEVYDESTESLETYTEYMEQAGYSTNTAADASDNLTESLEEQNTLTEEAQAKLDEYTQAAQNMFEVINTESDLTVDQMIANLDANAEAMRQYGENMAAIAGQIPQDMYDAIAAQGPEKMAAYVAQLAAASPEQLAQLSESWANAGRSGWDAFVAQFGGVDTEINPMESVANAVAGDTSLDTAITEKVQDAETAAELAVVSAGFDNIGKTIVNDMTTPLAGLYGKMYGYGQNAIQGLVNGILSMRSNVVAALNQIASAASSSFQIRLEIRSPSKLFYRFGQNITQGLVNGIDSGMRQVDAEIDRFSDIVAGANLPTGSFSVREVPGAATATQTGNTVNVTQNIYAERQTPAAMLREAKWQQERAVMLGV